MIVASILLMAAAAGIDRKVEPPPPAPAVVRPVSPALAGVRRVFVDRLTGGATAAQLRDLIISAIESSGVLVVTENEERADATLRGAAEDLVFTDKFISNDRISERSNSGQRSKTTKGITRGGQYGGLSISDAESTHIEERKHEAMATVRLVTKDGDVIWSTTQESRGGKFLGASAAVAARIARQLTADFDRVRKAPRLP